MRAAVWEACDQPPRHERPPTPVHPTGYYRNFQSNISVLGFGWFGLRINIRDPRSLLLDRVQNEHECPLTLSACLLTVTSAVRALHVAVVRDCDDRGIDHRDPHRQQHHPTVVRAVDGG